MDPYMTINTNASASRSDSGIEGGCSIGSGASLTINHLSTLETVSTVDASDAQSQEDIPFDGEEEESEARRENVDDEREDRTSSSFQPQPSAGLAFNRDSGESHSPESLDDEWCQVDNDQRSLSVQLKTNENNTGDERDRFSPVDFPVDLESAVTNDDNAEDNNRLFRKSCYDRGRLSSKEEKQRQNEEIVIMESSSVSSETGSWESVFPQRANGEVKDSCKSFLSNEKKYCSQSSSQSRLHCHEEPYVADSRVIAKRSTPLDVPSPSALRSTTDTNTTPAKSAHSLGACFIDASSLLDDEDVYPTSYTPQPILPAVACRGPKPHSSSSYVEKSKDSPEEDSDKDAWPKNAHLNRLETFHKDFQMCKMVKSPPDSAIDLTNDDDLHDDPPGLPKVQGHIINLSDEQKLNKRDKEQIVQYDIKDQYSSDSSSKGTSSVVSLAILNQMGEQELQQDVADRISGSNERQQDQERKQGTLVFQNSIQQFSGHVMSPKYPYTEDNYSDLSLPSIYSGSSEPYNDCTSAFETSSQYSSNCGDMHDYGGEGPHYSRGLVSETESVIYPDTPHNSIIHVDISRHVRRDDSGMVSSSPPPEISSSHQSKRALKCDESAPIVSGGVSTKDFTHKLCDSPSVRRKTEGCPIISGGAIPGDFEVEPKPRKVERPKLSAHNSWVVDMSDCNNKNKRRCSESSSSSVDNNGSRSTDQSIDRNGSSSSQKGLGFYVSLNDMKPPRLAEEVLSKSLNYRPNYSAMGAPKKRSTGFYIDLSESEQSQTSTPPPSKDSRTPPVNNNVNDKRNMFSMFIDFGEEKKRDQSLVQLSSSVPVKNGMNTNFEQSEITEDQLADTGKNKSHYMYIESDPPVVTHREVSSSQIHDDTKRHSWNTSKEESSKFHFREHKRSVSVSSTEKGVMSILEKIPLISKTSSMSIDTPNSNYDDMASLKSLSSCSNSLTSNSIHSSIGGNIPDLMNQSARRRQKDAKINETFDKSSQGSLTDGILSKNSSPTTDTEDVTFQNDIEEMARGSGGLMETIVESKETASPKKTSALVVEKTTKIEIPHTMETLQATIEKQKLLLDTVTEEVPMSSFVKLSDMDKPSHKFELHNTENMSKSVGSNRIGKLFDGGSRNGSRNSWHSMSRSTGNNLTNLASSVENLKSLSRIFPHLSKELSTSSPGDVDQDIFPKSPNDADLMQSDFSITSSGTSSFSRSGIDSADELSLSCRQPRRLGEDLLKMFLQEIATDVIIEVNGRRMRAHKCILRSRCQYFAAILAGGWVQSAGNVISLSGYSYGSVHFALCHIYSGASHPPDGISLMELAALADLLGLEGLKEVTAHALKTNYCHNFHKPCSGCIEGILQVFPVALNQGLDDLYRKCLRWACKHYMKVWPSRSFSQLPSDLIARCRQHIVAHMTSETVLNTLLDCDHLIALLASCRWAAGVENTVRDIIDAGHAYISDHFASLVASDGFLSLGHGQSWNISRLEDILFRTAATLTPDQACRSYQRVTRLNSVLGAKVIKVPAANVIDNGFLDQFELEHEEEMDWNPEFIRLVNALLSAVEQCLIRQCSRAMKITQWQRMDADLRKKIQKLACLTEPIVSRPRSNPKPVTCSPVAMHNSRTQDLYQVKLAIQAHSKRAQEVQSYRPPANNSNIYDRHAQANDKNNHQPIHDIRAPERNGTGKVSKSSSRAQVPDLIPTIKPKTPVAALRSERKGNFAHRRSQSETTNSKTATRDRPAIQVDAPGSDKPRLSDVKPRYLEPKRQRNTVLKNQTNLPLRQRNISSSDSSRTSSPVVSNRRKEPGVTLAKKPTVAESITMSRDSLSSPAKPNKLNKMASGASCNEYDHSVDSLGDSLRSSLKTDETKSQESLAHLEMRKSKENIENISLAGRVDPKVNKENLMVVPTERHSIAGRKPTVKKVGVVNSILSTCQTTSTNSSPSSVVNKGRLSSASSVSLTRDSHPKGRQVTTGSTPTGNKTTVRKSFLSARSKEILAKKESLRQSESTKSVPMTIREKINGTVNKSSSTSNIIRRPNAIPTSTTLHLRRSAKLSTSSSTSVATIGSQNSLMNPTKSSSMKMVAQNNKVNREKLEKKPIKVAKIEKELYAGDDQNEEEVEHIIIRPARVESKLERSSTFCKEVSDLPASELQIIE